MTHKVEGCAPKRMSFGCQELYISYYTIQICSIKLPIVYLLTCKKPESGPLPHCRDTLLKTRQVARRVVRRTNINTDLFVLNFCIHIIYIYASLYLRYQAIRACSTCPVEGDSGSDGPRSSDRSSHDRCRILEFWALKRSGLGHTEQNVKNLFISVLYDHKQCTDSN